MQTLCMEVRHKKVRKIFLKINKYSSEINNDS